MNDHISKSALLKAIKETVVVSGRDSNCGEMRGVRKVIDRIEAAPTVDAVEVVRCKGCDWYKPDCEECDFWGGYRDPEHFCGEGKHDG